MSVLDLTPIVQPILAGAGAIIAGFATIYVPKIFKAFEDRTGIMISAQNYTAMVGAVNTAAGMLETDLDKGILQVSHINVSNPSVLIQAQAAIAAVPKVAADLNMTVSGVARMIVGAVDTSAHAASVQVTAPIPSSNASPTILYGSLAFPAPPATPAA